jgi:hypothetical protein
MGEGFGGWCEVVRRGVGGELGTPRAPPLRPHLSTHGCREIAAVDTSA